MTDSLTLQYLAARHVSMVAGGRLSAERRDFYDEHIPLTWEAMHRARVALALGTAHGTRTR